MRALLNAPWYHSAPNSYALGIAQENGTLYIEERFDAERTLQLDRRAPPDPCLPGADDVRAHAGPAAGACGRSTTCARCASSASTGSPCPPDVKRAMIDWWGPVINECYGASELGYMTLLTSEQALRKPGSAGPADAGRGAEDPGRRRQRDAAQHTGPDLHRAAGHAGLQLRRQRRGTFADGSRRPEDHGRRRLPSTTRASSSSSTARPTW